MIERAHQQHPELSIERLCELLEVSRSWYYVRAGPPESDASETALRDKIERIILDFPGYSYRRVTHALSRQGWRVNHKHVLRIMREESLLCHLKKRFGVTTTNSRHGLPVYPNLLADFSVTTPDQAWVADLTYIRLRSAFVYLACILDACSRRCQSLRRPMQHCSADEEPRHLYQQKPAVFWVSIRPNHTEPRKLADVKRIAQNAQLGLTSVSVAVHLPWPD
jgi:hypothetical protein